MQSTHRKRLERAGWKVGAAEEFLGLSREESELIEVKLALGRLLRRSREKQLLTQAALAARLGSSQSRVAKIEAGDPSASMTSWSVPCYSLEPAPPILPTPFEEEIRKQVLVLPKSHRPRSIWFIWPVCFPWVIHWMDPPWPSGLLNSPFNMQHFALLPRKAR